MQTESAAGGDSGGGELFFSARSWAAPALALEFGESGGRKGRFYGDLSVGRTLLGEDGTEADSGSRQSPGRSRLEVGDNGGTYNLQGV
jgi:hypothetical protein